MSNIADIAAKLAIYWGNVAGAAPGQAVSTQGVGKPLNFQPGGAGSAVHARMHLDQTIPLAIAVISTPVAIGGVEDDAIANGETVGFTIDTTLATITFDGPVARLLNLSAVVSLITTAGSPVWQLHITVNGSIVASSQPNAATSAKNYHEMEITMTINPGDVIGLSGQNNTDTNNADIDQFIGLTGNTSADNISPTAGFLVVTPG